MNAVLTFLFPDDETSVTLEDLETHEEEPAFYKKASSLRKLPKSRASIAGSQLVESARQE